MLHTFQLLLLVILSFVNCDEFETTKSPENEDNPDHNDDSSEHSAPVWVDESSLTTVVARPYGSVVRLLCKARGNPEPNITWTKDGENIKDILHHFNSFKVTDKFEKQMFI